jgi:hypothetical protein
MNKDFMIGSIVMTNNGEEGMIIDKVLSYCNNSNYTTYLLMNKDKKVIMIDPEEICQIITLNCDLKS